MATYTSDEVRSLISGNIENPCNLCQIHSNSCTFDDCAECGNKCPCTVCYHNMYANMDSLSYGDKFTLIPKEENNLKTREDYLNAAMKATVSRDNNESTLPLIAKLWSPLFGIEVTPSMVATAMIALKLARIARGHEAEDSYVDIAGYAAIGGEAFSGAK